ncbi:MAG: hypothetical protein RMJ98_20290 [Myxococcales bacterium]|nr:hypothetical protein [Polyangiaceae bacterium]MDW8251641.1 hypothetical protein [Myxococcales bacterium]
MENRAFRLTLALVGGLLSGCNATRAKECNLLTTRINTGVERVEAFEKERLAKPEGGPNQTAQAMRQIAVLYREIAQEIRGLELSNKELKALAEDYQFEVRSASGAAESLATALEGKRPEETMTADKLYAKHLAAQKKVIERINGLCAR